MINFQPPRPSDSEVVAGWAAEALRDGRYNLGQVLAKIASQAEQHEIRQRAAERMAHVPLVGQTRHEAPARDFFDPRSNGTHLTVVNGIGPTGDGDLDLQQAAIGAQLEQTAVMARPEVSPAMPPESARCLAKVQRDGVADECRGVVYWLPGRVGDAVTPPATAGWRHVDPVVDEHHTPEVQV